MSHRGSLLFCPGCGALLAIPKDSENTVTCEQCAHVEPASSYENIVTVTRSHPDAFPSALRQKQKTQTKIHQGKSLPKVSERCPSCGHAEAYYEERQMRGADEGSTILYTVSSPAPTAFLSKTTAVRVLQTRVEGEQLGHTYTPTLQNKATTPNPPSALASDATPMAFRGKPVLGSVEK